MNWSEFKQAVDEKLIEELGPGCDLDSVEIDWIDIGDEIECIEVLTHNNHDVTVRVT